MSNDLISREKLRLVIRNIKKKADLFSNDDYRVGYISALSLVEGLLADAPAVDAEPVRHGRWVAVKTPYGRKMECSRCRNHDNVQTAIKGNYCWFCGAKMDGGNDE